MVGQAEVNHVEYRCWLVIAAGDDVKQPTAVVGRYHDAARQAKRREQVGS